MRILYCTMGRNTRVAGHFNYFQNELSKYCELKIISHEPKGHPADFINSIVKDEITLPRIIEKELISNDYDFIFTDALFCYLNERWDRFDTPFGMLLEDQHRVIPKIQVDFAVKHGFIIFNRYKLNKFHKDLTNTSWLPHCVNTDMFKDYGLTKKYKVLQTGAIWRVYKLRNFLKEKLKNESFYTYIKRPKETDKVKWPIKDDYAKVLNKSIFNIACGSEFQYPVQKFFEIPACNSILYSDYFSELKDLGFIPNINMIECNQLDPIGQLDKLLKSPDTLKELQINGLKLIKEKHTVEIRVQEFLENIMTLI